MLEFTPQLVEAIRNHPGFTGTVRVATVEEVANTHHELLRCRAPRISSVDQEFIGRTAAAVVHGREDWKMTIGRAWVSMPPLGPDHLDPATCVTILRR